MAKATPLPKAGRKAGAKPAKNRRESGAGVQPKRAAAKAAAKPARAAQGNRAPAPARQKLPAGGTTRVAERPAVTPEIPPPLPAPIASFTF